jgi:hypothetical protein
MGQNVCIGAVDADTGELLRLIPRIGAAYHSWQEFRADIGDLINVVGTKATVIDPPHVEDFLVDQWSPAGKKARDLAAWIRGKCRIWTGDRSSLFDGRLRYTSWGKGHIDRGEPLPTNSVGFWEVPESLILESGDKKRYSMAGVLPVSAPYVGLPVPPPTIAKGSLIRVSLSRWWAPDDGSMAEACWLQISGCY